MSVYGPSGRLSRRFGVPGCPSIARPSARPYTNGIGQQPILTIVYASIPPLARSVRTRWYGRSVVPGLGQMLAVRFPQIRQTSDYLSAKILLRVLSGPVLKHGRSSLARARVIGMHKPKGEMKVIVGFRVDRGSMCHVTMRPRTPGASRSHCEKRRT